MDVGCPGTAAHRTKGAPFDSCRVHSFFTAMAHLDDEPLRRFQTTHWSLIHRARSGAAQGRQIALDELLTRYLPALKAHLILRRRLRPDTADDFVQGFITEKVLEKNLLDHADQSKGRFRSLLIRSLENYVVDQLRREKGKQAAAMLEDLDRQLDITEAAYAYDVFDAQWARATLSEAINRMRSECQRDGRSDVWGIFEQRLLKPILHGQPQVPYEVLVQQYQLRSPAQASNLLITAKRHFQRVLTEVIGEYVSTDEELQSDVAELFQIVARAGPIEQTIPEDFLPPAKPTHPRPTSAEVSDSALAIRLLSDDDVSTSVWAEHELASVFAHQLSIRLNDLFADTPTVPATNFLDNARQLTPPIITLGELLLHPHPPLELLRAVKGLARSSTSGHTSTIAAEVASVVYFAAIAAALVHCGQRITRSDNKTLLEGFRVALERPWLTEPVAQSFQTAVEQLGRS